MFSVEGGQGGVGSKCDRVRAWLVREPAGVFHHQVTRQWLWSLEANYSSLPGCNLSKRFK